MAHLIIEYSANLDPEIRPQVIVDTLHAATLATGVFALGDVRTRAVCQEAYRVGSQALADYLDPIYRCTPLAISAELQQIDPQFCFKKNKL